MKKALLAFSLLTTLNLQATSWPFSLCGTHSETPPITPPFSFIDTFPSADETYFIRYGGNRRFAATPNPTQGTVTIYKVNQPDRSLEAIQTVTSAIGASYLSYSPNSFAVVANVGNLANSIESSITVYKVNEKSGKWHLVQILSPQSNPEVIAPQSLSYSPDGKFVALSDSGTNCYDGSISIYAVNNSGFLSLTHSYKTAELEVTGIPGALTYHPDGKFLACTFRPSIGNATVLTFPVDPTTGELSLPAGIGSVRQLPFEITFSDNGKFVAVSNKTPHTTSVFMIDETGALTEVNESPFSRA